MAKIAIVVGHDEKSQGARATAPLNCSEYVYNKELAAMIACALMDEGMQSEIFFRDRVGIEGAYAEVNDYAPSAVIELHFNSSGVGSASGSETLYVPKIHTSDSLARLVHAGICLALGRKGAADRGVKIVQPKERGYINLISAQFPSILIEPFFGDNKADSLLAKTYKLQLAKGIAQSLVAFVETRNALH